jgi:hypothetical protein
MAETKYRKHSVAAGSSASNNFTSRVGTRV